jgi:hypothetical protein
MGETMVEIREFFNAQSAFDPEAIQTLASALEDVWRTVETSGSRFARPAYARAIREVLAKRIIEVAQRGEKDKRKLAADALKSRHQIRRQQHSQAHAGKVRRFTNVQVT